MRYPTTLRTPMRICLYTSTALPKLGGQELVVDALARCFTADGHHVVVLAPRPRRGQSADMKSLPYATVWHPRFRSTRWGVGWYRWWLSRLHAAEQFDVIHCHDIYPTGYVASCARSLRTVPLVITSHGGDVAPDGLLARKPQLLARYVAALCRADAVIAISSYTEQRVREIHWPVRCLQRIPNGVDLSLLGRPAARPGQIPPHIQPGKYLLFLGRLERRKGVDDLIVSLPRGEQGGGLPLVIAGDGPERKDLQRLAAQTGLSDRCWFAGAVTGDVKTWLLQNSYCLVVPSRLSEAFALVVLESYAAGRPVIATALPGLQDLIRPGQTGWLVPPENRAAMAAAIAEAIAQPERVAQMGRQARSLAEDYGWPRIARRHLALYEQLSPSRRMQPARAAAVCYAVAPVIPTTGLADAACDRVAPAPVFPAGPIAAADLAAQRAAPPAG